MVAKLFPKEPTTQKYESIAYHLFIVIRVVVWTTKDGNQALLICYI